MARRRPRTPDERRMRDDDSRRKLAELHDLLHTELGAVYTGEDWARLLRMTATLHGQSFANVVLIDAQRPGATMVAGYEAWQALGRQVAKGQPGIRVIAEPGGEDTAPASVGRSRAGGTRRAAVKDHLRSTRPGHGSPTCGTFRRPPGRLPRSVRRGG